MAPLFDSHCHIHDPEYDFVVDEVLDENRSQGLVGCLAVGTNYRSSLAAVDLASRDRSVWASAALHPHEATADLAETEAIFARLKSLVVDRRQHISAIGECGLDYYYHKDPAIRQRQQTIFGWHLDLAKDLDLPLVFHIRDAWDDFWRLYQAADQPQGILHSFSDRPEIVTKVLDDHPNLLFGLNGIMTFSRRPEQLEAAKMIPIDRLVLETDAPYLTPPPHRGRPNRPAYLPLIAQFLAELRQYDYSDLARATTSNSQRILGIKD